MWILFVILFYYFILGVFFQKTKNNSSRKYEAFWGGVILFLILALRSPICGNDLLSSKQNEGGYFFYFVHLSDCSLEQIISGQALPGIEIGWQIYSWFVAQFNPNFQFFLIVTAALEIFLIGYTIYKNSSNIIMSYMTFVCMGLYFFSFSGIRQAIAYSITFFAYNFLKEKKWIYFILIVWFASTFHSSAIFFLLMLLCGRIKLDIKKSIIGLVTIICALPFLTQIVTFISMTFFSDRGLGYIDEGGAYTLFLVYVIMFVLTMFINKHSYELNIFKWSIFLSAASQSTGLISNGSITRIAFYFSIMNILFFSECIEKQIKNINTEVCKVVFYTFIIIYLLYTSKGGFFNALPYHFYWEYVI